jgi:hypothetical protein
MKWSVMTENREQGLRERVETAAEAVLAANGSVGPLELLQQLQFLAPSHVRLWRNGHEYATPLEPRIQCGAKKLEQTYRFFQEWVAAKGLKPVEARYVRAGAAGVEDLHVSGNADPEKERFFRTHYGPAGLSKQKDQQLEKRLSKTPDLVVYQMVSERAECSECQAELFAGDAIFMEKGQVLCLTCADLDHLEFLPSGGATLTRRARKNSPLSAVVVRFQRRRRRYERQGILVTHEAIAQAEAACEADAEDRAARREVDARRRQKQDRQLESAMMKAILDRYPNCPAREARRIAEYTSLRGSGRVGRSSAGRALAPEAIDLAVMAAVRHNHTEYDSLLMRGADRHDARAMVRPQIDQVLWEWKGE